MSLSQALADSHLYTAAGDGKVAYISRDDLALATAAALASDDTSKRVYTLTGAEAFSTEEITRLVSEAIKTPLEVVQVPVEGLIQGMVAATGMPEAVAAEIASFDTNTNTSTKAGRVSAPACRRAAAPSGKLPNRGGLRACRTPGPRRDAPDRRQQLARLGAQEQ